MEQPQVRVGIGVFVIKDGKFLLQKRQGSHGEGTWSLPGGHLEYGESFEETARREVREESGLEIQNVRFGAVTNDIFSQEHKHYVTVWMLSRWLKNDVRNNEPDKCTAQQWHTLESLPEPLFTPWHQLLNSAFIDTIREELAKHHTPPAV